MNDFQFASSLVSSLAWPLVVIVLGVVFREQVAGLIGRITSYKGMGQELTFGDRLADAENSVEEAARSVPIDKGEAEQTGTWTNPLARDADANPSFVVISSWEQVVSSLNDLAGIALPGRYSPFRAFSSNLLRELQKMELVKPEFVTAVMELRDLRNKVAHGQHNPTPGEAVAYAESAQLLAVTARFTAEVAARDRQPL